MCCFQESDSEDDGLALDIVLPEKSPDNCKSYIDEIDEFSRKLSPVSQVHRRQKKPYRLTVIKSLGRDS